MAAAELNTTRNEPANSDIRGRPASAVGSTAAVEQAEMLLLFVAGMALCGNLIHATHSAIVWGFCAGAVCVSIVAYSMRQHWSAGWWSRVRSPLIFIWIVVMVLAMSSLHRESSYDGLNYHSVPSLRAALFLGRVDTLPLAGEDWADAYPKAFEYFATSAYLMTGKFNSGLAFNPLLAIALACYVFHYFRHLYPQRWALVITTLIVLNPVVVQQFLSLYVDAAHYMCWMVVMFGGMLLVQGWRPSFIATACAACLLVSSKLTGPALLGITAVMAAVFFWRKLRSAQGKQWAAASALGCVIGMTVLGASPYVSNVMSGKHILSPAMGENAIDLVTSQIRPEFKAKWKGYKLFVSWFYPPQSGHAQSSDPIRYRKVELSFLGQPDARIGAFGPLFPLMMLMGLILAAKARYVSAGSCFLLVCTAATVVVHPGSWWVRYVPVSYLIPLLLNLPRAGEPPSRLQKAFYAIIFFNGLIVCAAVVLHELSAWFVYDYQLSQARRCVEPISVRADFLNHAMNLYDDGIKVRAASENQSGGPCSGVFEDIDVSDQRLTSRLRAIFSK